MLGQISYLEPKYKQAIEAIQMYAEFLEPGKEFYVAFSGGKDSIILADLFRRSGVPYKLHYSVTGIDPPEVIYFMRKHYPELVWDYPGYTMWSLIVQKGMPPTRIARYCCEKLKEGGGAGEFVSTGVRWGESVKRKKNRGFIEINTSNRKSNLILLNDNEENRRQFETCPLKGKRILNPIVNFSDDEVWDYIHNESLSYPELYDKGWKRLGCIGCPMSTKRKNGIEVYSEFKRLYLRAFDRMLLERERRGKETKMWNNAQDVYDWWVGDKKIGKYAEDQISLEELELIGGE